MITIKKSHVSKGYHSFFQIFEFINNVIKTKTFSYFFF